MAVEKSFFFLVIIFLPVIKAIGVSNGFGVHTRGSSPSSSTSTTRPLLYTPTYNGKLYGNAFGSAGLSKTTHIFQNYFGGPSDDPPKWGYKADETFLRNALAVGGGMSFMSWWANRKNYKGSWDEDDDWKWRATTKSPYFENKVPGSESYLPAAAVVGAATAFGLFSLLPLNVPAHKPFMYCNGTEVAQAKIWLNGKIYSCGENNSIMVSCPKAPKNAKIIDECLNSTMDCDVAESLDGIYCSKATLLSRQASMCNSTKAFYEKSHEMTTILNCYPEALPNIQASFIPTTTKRPDKKILSFGSHVHIFFLKLTGQHKDLEGKKEDECDYKICEVDHEVVKKEKSTRWIADSLEIMPELSFK